MISRVYEKINLSGQRVLDLLFKPPETRIAKYIIASLLAGLFAIGLFHWYFFLGGFSNRFDLLDWHIHVGPYLSFLRKAFQAGQLPLYADSPLIDPAQYLARHNRPFSPQILLLYFLKPQTYVLVNVWIMYTIGFIGLLLFRRKYDLPMIAFLPVFLLFNFNGHITSHLVVGHAEWVGYFLLPFFILLVLRLLEGEKAGWQWQLSMAVTLLVINLQGAIHFFIWCLAFLILLAVFQPRFWSQVIKAVVISILVSMIRILPPALYYYGDSNITYLGGFSSTIQILESFLVSHLPAIEGPRLIFQQGQWEIDYYIGMIGFAYLLFFGLVKTDREKNIYRALYLPMLVMTILSLGDLYRPFFSAQIPFLDSQRAPSRFLIVPLVFVITLASIRFKAYIEGWGKDHWKEKIFIFLSLAPLVNDLYQHSRYWRLEYIYAIAAPENDAIQVALGGMTDPLYETAIIIGSILTVATIIVIIALAVHERKKLEKFFPV